MSTDVQQSPGGEDLAATIWRWTHQVCQAPSRMAGDLADAMGLDPAAVTELGSQRIFTPPLTGSEYCEFVVDDDGTVLYVDITPDADVTVEQLSALFGPAFEAPPGPHDIAPTILFRPVTPDGTTQGCRMHARLVASEPQTSTVETIFLTPHPH